MILRFTTIDFFSLKVRQYFIIYVFNVIIKTFFSIYTGSTLLLKNLWKPYKKKKILRNPEIKLKFSNDFPFFISVIHGKQSGFLFFQLMDYTNFPTGF